MTVGGDTFIHDMLTRCGCINIFAYASRYPATTLEQIRYSGLQLMLLSSEPYPFGQKHIAEIQAELPETQILLVNGEYFSWYGSRLTGAAAYFQSLMKQFQKPW
jgi:hypothetical protein